MTPLEKRLIEDMKLFGYSKRTQDTYLYAVRKITNHFQTSPNQITNEQLREYLLWHKDKYAPNTIPTNLSGPYVGLNSSTRRFSKSPCRSLTWPASRADKSCR